MAIHRKGSGGKQPPPEADVDLKAASELFDLEKFLDSVRWRTQTPDYWLTWKHTVKFGDRFLGGSTGDHQVIEVPPIIGGPLGIKENGVSCVKYEVRNVKDQRTQEIKPQLDILLIQKVPNGPWEEANEKWGVNPHEKVMLTFLEKMTPLFENNPAMRVVLDPNHIEQEKNPTVYGALRKIFFRREIAGDPNSEWILSADKIRVRRALGEDNAWVQANRQKKS